jgi:hypothetical protein
LQLVLSWGRKNGMALMVRVIQQQIMSLVGGETSFSNGKITANMAGEKMSPFFDALLKNVQSQSNRKCTPLVAMLLSGGVDLLVALHPLLRQNYNLIAFYLHI